MKILITGDFCPINRVSDSQNDINIFGDFNNLLNEVDYRITNLECPLTNYEIPIKKTGPALKASPEFAKLLKKAQFDLVTLANNHIMDYGSIGIKDTIQALKSNYVDFIGGGDISEELAIKYKVIQDINIAIVNLCENEWSTDDRDGYKANGFSELSAFYSIKTAKKNAKYVVVIHHGGHEMYNLPSPRLKSVLRYFIDCGADAVINHHTHCIGGYEIYNERPIFYSLGNFVFDKPHHRDSMWNYGMAVILNFDENGINFDIRYFEQFNKNPYVTLINENDLPYSIDEINKIIESDDQLFQSFSQFLKKKQELFNFYLEPVNSKLYNFFKKRGMLPSFWSKRKKFYLKNLINCESHREILQEILKKETLEC